MRFIAAMAIVLGTSLVMAENSEAPAKEAAAIEKGLAFLVKDSTAWKEERACHSCHHASMVVWSLQEAKLRGHTVDEPFLAETTKWLAESGDGKVGVPRPEGIPKALNTKAVWYGLALGADPKPDEVTRTGLDRMLATVKSDQVESGAWQAWPETRPPMFGPSDEKMTALALLALVPGAANGDAEAKAALEKGVKWLAETKSDDDPQSVALRLVLWKRVGRPATEFEPLVQRIKERQNSDGGWSQTKEMASDGWATGQALYALAHAEIAPSDPVLVRGRTFLVESQREDGAWAMTSRPSKPGDMTTNMVPITISGSSWAILGLVRSR